MVSFDNPVVMRLELRFAELIFEADRDGFRTYGSDWMGLMFSENSSRQLLRGISVMKKSTI